MSGAQRLFPFLLFLLLVANTACSKDDDLLSSSDSIAWNAATSEEHRDGKDSISFEFTGAEKFLDLSNAISGVQGSACYGDYFFQGYNTNSRMDVYNIKTGKFICRIQVPSPPKSTRYHANTVNFGNQFVDENDMFPVLYVCSGYTKDTSSSESYVFVYRILETEKHTFQLELIQTITLLDFGVNLWTEAILDNEHDAIWIKSNACIYRKFQVPLISEGDCIISPHSGVLQEVNVGTQPFASHNQGHLFYKGRILLATGVPAWNEKIALVVINPLTNEREVIVDLFDLGLVDSSNPLSNRFEPEGVIVVDDQIMICYPKAIYKLIR